MCTINEGQLTMPDTETHAIRVRRRRKKFN